MINAIYSKPEGIGYWRAPRLSDGSFSTVVAERDNVIVAAGAQDYVEYPDRDSIFRQYSGATVDKECDVIALPTSGDGEIYLFESLNEDIATVDASGQVTRVTDGNVGILTRGKYEIRRDDVSVLREVGTITYELYNFAIQSLAKDAYTVLAPLANQAGRSMDIYSTRDIENKLFVRNSNFWGASLDMTAVAAFGITSIDGQSSRAATMITDTHFIQAEHWSSPQGTKLYFVDRFNVVYERTVAVPPYRVLKDLSIGTLDAPLPSSIKPMQLPTANWDTQKVGHPEVYPPNQSATGVDQLPSTKVPAVCTNQYGKASFTQLGAVSYDSAGTSICAEGKCVMMPFTNYEIQVISGDSGSPSFRYINGQPVLFTTWWGAYGGVDFSKYVSQINAYIAPKAVVVADFSNFLNWI